MGPRLLAEYLQTEVEYHGYFSPPHRHLNNGKSMQVTETLFFLQGYNHANTITHLSSSVALNSYQLNHGGTHQRRSFHPQGCAGRESEAYESHHHWGRFLRHLHYHQVSALALAILACSQGFVPCLAFFRCP